MISTGHEAADCPGLMTMTTVDAVTTLHVAAVVVHTRTEQDCIPGMKLAPTIVMMLPAYPDFGTTPLSLRMVG